MCVRVCMCVYECVRVCVLFNQETNVSWLNLFIYLFIYHALLATIEDHDNNNNAIGNNIYNTSLSP